MLIRKLWRTMGLYKAQFISMIIMIILGIGVFVGFNMEWYSIEVNTNNIFDKTHFENYRILDEKGFSKDDVNNVANINGVTDASRFVSMTVDVKEIEGDTLALTVTENKNVSFFILTSGEEYDEKSEDGIWLSDQYANKNNIKLGDTLTLTYKNIEIEGTVKGLIKSGNYMICVRDETQLMPDFSAHGFCYISPKMYEKAVGFAYYPQINVLSDLEKEDFLERANDSFKKTMVILTRDEHISYSGASGEKEEGQTMGSILPVIFLLIAVLTMVTTMHRLCAKEKTQIGTLKALGFKDRKIQIHYTSYAFMVALVGSVIGSALGYFIAWVVMNPKGMMGTYMDLPEWKLVLPWYCWGILLVLLLGMTLIGFLSAKEMLKGTASDALRPYTPKKVKPLFLERFNFFHKLSFGTRWNLRDTIRHKSRTAMSLIGVISCTIIILASLGMSDTMDKFIDLYYNGALNYSSRIYFSETATDEEKNEIIEKYNGDWSNSISVQLKDKTIALDIYQNSNGYLNLLGNNDEIVILQDNGAYICTRLSDEFGVKIGDTVTVSLFGSDEKYELKIIGISHSMTENIAVSSKYAKEKNIKFSPDSVYTKTEKVDIKQSSAIKTVQSKQMIISSFDSFMKIMDIMVYILVLGALLLGVVVLYNLGVMSYTERYREMATLKVVGFNDGKIGRILIGQNLWTSVIGLVLGLPSGVALLDYLIKALASEYELTTYVSPFSFIISVILIFGVSLIVSLMVAKKNKKIDMVESLKSAE